MLDQIKKRIIVVSRGKNNYEEVESVVLNYFDFEDFDYENRIFDVGDVSFTPGK